MLSLTDVDYPKLSLGHSVVEFQSGNQRTVCDDKPGCYEVERRIAKHTLPSNFLSTSAPCKRIDSTESVQHRTSFSFLTRQA